MLKAAAKIIFIISSFLLLLTTQAHCQQSFKENQPTENKKEFTPFSPPDSGAPSTGAAGSGRLH